MEYQPRMPREGINTSSRHPLAELVTLVAGICLAVVVIATATFALVEGLIRWIPPSFESRVFWSLWSADVGSDSDDPSLAAAAGLLERLASHWEKNPYQLQLAIRLLKEVNRRLPNQNLLEASLDEIKAAGGRLFAEGEPREHGRFLTAELRSFSASGRGRLLATSQYGDSLRRLATTCGKTSTMRSMSSSVL